MSDASPPRTSGNLRARLAVMMFLQYFVQGCYLPIVTVYLQEALGFDSQQIGNFTAALAVGPLLAAFLVGQVVDRHFQTQRVLAFAHAAGGVVMLLIYIQTKYLPVLALGALYSVLYVPTMMLTNSLAFSHLMNREREFPLIRLAGTIGFVLPAWLIEGVFLANIPLDQLDFARGIALAFSGVAGLVMAGYALTLPRTPPRPEAGSTFAPAEVLKMLKLRDFLVLVLVTLGIGVAHKFFFVHNSPYLKAMLLSVDIRHAYEARISSIGQIAEVLVMVGLGWMVMQLGFKWTLSIGASAYVLRCVIFAFAATLEGKVPVLTLICLGQAMHGLCFACFLAAAFMYVDRISPPDVRGSMQNFYGTTVLGLGLFVGGIISGRLGTEFTFNEGEESVREKLGFAGQRGITPIDNAELMDWSGLWLSGAAIAAVCLVGLVLFFPRGRAEGEE